MRFDASSFVIAGALASLIPIIIHLVNRRQYQTVEWAAMAFLREAIERNRRVLHLRDVLLLAVRMMAVLLFGFLLARTFILRGTVNSMWQTGLLLAGFAGSVGFAAAWTTSKPPRSHRFAIAAAASLLIAGWAASNLIQRPTTTSVRPSNSRIPVHAVLVIDNSRSLGVESAGGTLFDRARAMVSSFIATLPLGSRITVIPLAGSEEVTTLDAYHNKLDAQRALDHLKLVDTEGNLRTGIEQAERASQQTPFPADKRFVLLCDAQANAWQAISQSDLKRLEGWQIVNVTKSAARNVWVSHLRAEDGVASTESLCRFHARVQTSAALTPFSTASDESFEVQASLSIDGLEVASKSLTMSADQDREIEFLYQFEGSADPLLPHWAIAAVTVQVDRQSVDQLPQDNRQQIAVPVTASIPVIFIDQYGDRERVEQNQIGETHALRHLMAPRLKRQNSERPLIQISHLRPEQVTQDTLRSARLIVIGGVERPDDALVTLLHEFVQQGGPLVILAGGPFDPAAWTEAAWRDGNGILPAPLEPTPLGQTPEEASQQLKPFFVEFSSLQDSRFLIEGEDPQALSALFEATPFFKAIRVNLNSAAREASGATDANELVGQQRQDDHRTEPNATTQTSTPAWWAWRSPLPRIDRSRSPADPEPRDQPRVLATFDHQHAPFAVERHFGAGRVLLFTSGVSSNWNLLRSSGALYLFHRTFFQFIDQTFPQRTFQAGQTISVPVEHRRNNVHSVTRPSGETETLPVDAVNASVGRATIRRPFRAGTYIIKSESFEHLATDPSATKSVDEISLSVNGAESESDLATLSNQELGQLIGTDAVRLLAHDEPIELEGTVRKGYELSKSLGWCALGFLLFEMGLLAWPAAGNRRWLAQLAFRHK